MNEFDKDPFDFQPSPENQPTPDTSAEVPEAPVGETPVRGIPNEETPAQPSSPSGGYSYRGDQLSNATTRIGQQGGTQWYGSYSSYGAPSGGNSFSSANNANNAPSGEYEVSFDSASGKYTYTDHSTPAPEQPPRRPKSGKGLLAVGLCVTILASTLLGVFGGAAAAALLIKDDEKKDANLHSSVQQSTVVQVNSGDVNYGAISNAAVKCYDSVVVIETFLSQSYADAGEASGAGSGVIWTEDGYIVTCNHVIDGAEVIRVAFTDGSTFYADVVGQDSQTDLAVLKIEATGLKAVSARGSSLVLGETAIAIGNPLGVLANSVSEGILSCLARDITIEGQEMSLLQTTAAVNSGNSGGGLFDINGSLIGIVNAKSTGDSVEGLGFAIPIETVMEISNQIIEQGFVSGRPQLGIGVITVSQSNANAVFAEPEYAALEEYATKITRDPWGREYTQVVPGTYILDTTAVVGYADGSDSLMFGDKILYVGNTEIESSNDVKAALNGYSAGETIQLTVLRGQSQTIIINLILGQLGES